jgi:hypothetical protein
MIKKRNLLFVVVLIIFLSINLIHGEISITGNYSLNESPQWQQNLTNISQSSLAFGDVDNDGDLDLALSGCLSGSVTTCSSSVSKIYINNGTSLLENSTWGQNLIGISRGSLAFGDIDNDGDLDLLLNGCTNNTQSGNCDGTRIAKIYLNNGSTLTESSQWQDNLTGIFYGSLTFGDIDNDGDLDLALSGKANSRISKIYINNGTSFVESSQWQSNLTAVYESSLALGDLDNDGDLDLVLSGDRITSPYMISKVYINNGSSLIENLIWQNNLVSVAEGSFILGNINNDTYLDLLYIGCCDRHLVYFNNFSTFYLYQTDIQGGGDYLIGQYDGSIAFGDYDNDGDLDHACMGLEAYNYNRIYNYNGSIFIADSNASLGLKTDNIASGSLVFGDLDRDNDLDLVATGMDNNGNIKSKVYISNASSTKNNTLPTPPNIFTSSYSVTNNNLTLGWGNGSDAETPSTGLYYNLMIGNSTTNNTVVSGVYGGSSNPTAGYFGNMMERKNLTLNLVLPNGTYYWYVQTIDTGLAKSNWSAVQSFIVNPDATAPTISGVSSSVTTSTATIIWTTNEMANSSVYYGTTTSTTSSSGSTQWIIPHSIGLSGLTASTKYYYNVSSCDDSGNCATSSQYSFTTSDEPVSPPGGGGSSGGGRTPTIVNKTIPLFDIDFSTSTSGILEAKQGDVKTFSFNGEIKHSITPLVITTNSITLLITSTPIALQINTGETKQIDINNDKINDFEINLISIISGKAKFSLTKLSGADIVAEEEIEKQIKKEALFDAKVSLSNLFNIVKTGREVIAKIEVLNVNNIGQVDVGVDYYITSKYDNETKLAEGSDTLAVEAIASFVRSLTVPYNLKAGKYLFNVDVKYQGKILASGSAEFMVIKTYEILIAVGVVVLIVAGIFIYLWRIKRKEERLEKKESRLERKIRVLEGIKRWKKWRNKRKRGKSKKWQKQR